MSIYSGFATRQQQHQYDNLLLDLISVLQRRIIKFYTGQAADQVKFNTILTNLQYHLAKMEESKYLEPKISRTFGELMEITKEVSSKEQDKTVNNSNNSQKIANHTSNSQPVKQLRREAWMDKQSLNNSTAKINQVKSTNFGRIKHQSTNKDDAVSSRGQSNPQFILDKQNMKQLINLDKSKDKNGQSRQGLQKWGVMFDQPPDLASEQKKNVQYIIRGYVSRGQQRRKHRKMVQC